MFLGNKPKNLDSKVPPDSTKYPGRACPWTPICHLLDQLVQLLLPFQAFWGRITLLYITCYSVII